MSELQITLRPQPKKRKIKTLNFPIFNLNIVCLNNPLQRGSSAINMFSNSKMSEFDVRGGGGATQFSNNSEIKKTLNYPGEGGGVRPNWEFFKNNFVF